ncbi:unannotated protein [freshwater metagenome]|uniref:Unannotated protein n=1 Tax=freshwater metagenome TaxID=449393 RepID=A0A6J6V4L5_9ZZZZ|nr:hypothetical protein [Actinomycetota bacterium]MSX32020.1 hypothetical protein [Actinomycetota bacterium]MSZ28822.1 hypothetical protein [Actinomycetota bacterium]
MPRRSSSAVVADLREYVARLAEQSEDDDDLFMDPLSDNPDGIPTGDDIAAELEEFLREQGLG